MPKAYIRAWTALAWMTVCGGGLMRAAQAEEAGLDEIVVLGVAPSNLEHVTQDRIALSHSQTTAALLNQAVISAVLSDTEASPFQKDIVYRGFLASPVLGTPQGIAVFQNGTRVNERFGDVLLWDLTPSFAIERIDVVPGSDPVLGLNALGGAIAIQMKTGFDKVGRDDDVDGDTALELSGGSFGRVRLVAETTYRHDDFGLYLGGLATHEDGWRDYSPSDVLQAYGDASLRGGWGEAGISVLIAGDTLNGNGAVPIEDARTAAYAISDTSRDRVFFAQARGKLRLDDQADLIGHAYFRSTQIATFNGGVSGFQPCEDGETLCTADGDELTSGGAPVSTALGGTGTVPEQTTDTNALGASAELDARIDWFGIAQSWRLGLGVDYAHTGFDARTLLGNYVLIPGGTNTISNGVALDGPDYNTRLGTLNLDGSLFAEDTVTLLPSLVGRAAVRLNGDRIALSDRLGGDLTGRHGYASANPSAGLTWQIDETSRVYVSAGQSNRIPTAAELSCADPSQPCLFPLSFVSDPGLKQVIARTVEIGAEASRRIGEVRLHSRLALYQTRNQDDIIFVSAGPTTGSGYFTNVGATRRRGLDFEIDGGWEGVEARLSYGYVAATYRSTFTILSPNNPAADENGEIQVTRGDRLPGIPEHVIKLAASWQVTPKLRLSADAQYQTNRYYRGDEANLQSPLPPFFLLNADLDYQVAPGVTLTIEAENITDRRYATFGLYADPSGNGALPQFSDPRFLSPSEPFGIWGGVRLAF